MMSLTLNEFLDRYIRRVAIRDAIKKRFKSINWSLEDPSTRLHALDAKLLYAYKFGILEASALLAAIDRDLPSCTSGQPLGAAHLYCEQLSTEGRNTASAAEGDTARHEREIGEECYKKAVVDRDLLDKLHAPTVGKDTLKAAVEAAAAAVYPEGPKRKKRARLDRPATLEEAVAEHAGDKAKRDTEHLQPVLISLFKALAKELGSHFTVHDTHASNYLRMPDAQIDCSFFAGNERLWISLVWLAQFKIGHTAPEWNICLGQIFGRVWKLFQQQPHRTRIIAAALSTTAIEVYVFTRVDFDKPLYLVRSGLLDLSLTPESTGMKELTRLFVSSPTALGFSEPTPGLTDMENISAATLVRRGGGSNPSMVYRAVHAEHGLVAVKLTRLSEGKRQDKEVQKNLRHRQTIGDCCI